MVKKQSTGKLTQDIIVALSSEGHFASRNNSGVAKNKDGSFTRYGVGPASGKGGSDIIGCTKDGYFLAVEVKNPDTKDKATAEQKMFISWIKMRGGRAGIAHSVEEALTIAKGS